MPLVTTVLTPPALKSLALTVLSMSSNCAVACLKPVVLAFAISSEMGARLLAWAFMPDTLAVNALKRLIEGFSCFARRLKAERLVRSLRQAGKMQRLLS